MKQQLAKRILRLGALTTGMMICLAATVSASTEAFENVKVGQAIPAFELKTVDGKTISSQALKGNVFVVAFWRPDQQRSFQMLEDLQKLDEELKSKDVKVLGVVSGQWDGTAINKAMEDAKAHFPTLLDSERKVYGDFGVIVAPATGVVDAEGKLAYYFAGYRPEFFDSTEGEISVLLGLMSREELEQKLQPREVTLSASDSEAQRHLSLGKKMMAKGLLEQATQEFQKAAEKDPGTAAAQVQLGYALLQEQKLSEADAAFSKACEIEPNSGEAKAGLGVTKARQGKPDEAEKLLQEALQNGGGSGLAHYELGKILESKGDLKQAVEVYRTALEKLLASGSK